jgi:uncharacterized protein YheU (UPF0270 family)
MYNEPETDESLQGIDIPYEQLKGETLQRMIEEFVTRDGSNWEGSSADLAAKVAQVMVQLKHKKIKVVFDLQSQSANLVVC